MAALKKQVAQLEKEVKAIRSQSAAAASSAAAEEADAKSEERRREDSVLARYNLLMKHALKTDGMLEDTLARYNVMVSCLRRSIVMPVSSTHKSRRRTVGNRHRHGDRANGELLPLCLHRMHARPAHTLRAVHPSGQLMCIARLRFHLQ